MSRCEVAHTSLLIGRPSLLFGRSTAYAVVRRSSKTAPLRRGFFAPHALFLSVFRAGKLGTTRGWVWRVNAKGPVSDNGAFRTFLRWRGMLSDPTAFSIRHALICSRRKWGGWISPITRAFSQVGEACHEMAVIHRQNFGRDRLATSR